MKTKASHENKAKIDFFPLQSGFPYDPPSLFSEVWEFFWQMDPFASFCEGEGNLRVFSPRPHINPSLFERCWPPAFGQGKKQDKAHASLLNIWVRMWEKEPTEPKKSLKRD